MNVLLPLGVLLLGAIIVYIGWKGSESKVVHLVETTKVP